MTLAWLFRLLKIEVIPPQEVQRLLDQQQAAMQASIVAINQALETDKR